MCSVWFHLEFSTNTTDKQESLEREILQYKEQISALQDRLDSVTKVRDGEFNIILLDNCLTHQSLIVILCYLIFLAHVLTQSPTSFSFSLRSLT